ncbi:acetyltransferase [Brumimicrobium oceani]|uniref:N-acetylneuraminate synthase n=1 Tax=Brumimicrobium oceani TaxID=2100725 RepID=A0A2U2XF34_9FLAO|nr:acetyltransferase [Brumimicrobium oceani]PWH86404.1 N-acetylneuraminate synthase [Brumimicrobium oceani]
MKKTILAGYSGHGFVVAEAALLSDVKIDGYLEPNEVFPNYFDLEYLGFETDPNFDWSENNNFILGIGDNQIRHKLGSLISSKEKVILNIIHPSASVTEMLKIGVGNFIARNASINPLAEISDFCIINTGAIVEHECKIKDAVHIGPGAVLAGNVEIGENNFIGANSVVKQGVKVGKNVIIGAGSVIIKNVEDNSKIVGNPGRKI